MVHPAPRVSPCRPPQHGHLGDKEPEKLFCATESSSGDAKAAGQGSPQELADNSKDKVEPGVRSPVRASSFPCKGEGEPVSGLAVRQKKNQESNYSMNCASQMRYAHSNSQFPVLWKI